MSILETAFSRRINYDFDMRDWVTKAVEHSNLSQADIVRRLHTQYGWSENKTIFNKIYTGKRELGAKEMFDISRVTGFPIPSLGAPDWQSAVRSALRTALGSGADRQEIVTFVVDETIRMLAELAHNKGADVRRIVEDVAGSPQDIPARPEPRQERS